MAGLKELLFLVVVPALAIFKSASNIFLFDFMVSKIAFAL